MATTVARLEAILTADTRRFNRSMDQASGKTDTFGSKLSGLAKGAAFAAGAAGIAGLTYAIHAGISEWTESTKIAAQTEAVIKSTGGVANVTAGHVQDLANAILRKSGIDDEAAKSGENMLLTFVNIRNEVGKGNNIFDQATNVLADMSVALGKDMKTSAIQLGKALNDPIKGITALRRVGVAFTKQQTDQIKALVESGHTMEAQKVILKELNREFGGSAAAMGKTLPGQIKILRESFNNFAGDLVAKMIPALTNFGNWIRIHWPEIRDLLKETWASIGPALSALVTLVQSVAQVFVDNWGTIGPIVRSMAQVIQDVFAVITPTIQLVADLLRGDWSQAWVHFKDMVTGMITLAKDVVIEQTAVIRALLTNLGPEILAGLQSGISALGSVIQNAFSAAGSSAQSFGASLATGILSGLAGGLSGIGSAITGSLGDLTSWGASVGTGLKNAIVNAVVGVGQDVWNVINNIGEYIANKASVILGWGADVGAKVKNAAVGAVTGIGQAAWDVINNIGEYVVNKASVILGWGSDIGNKVKNAVLNTLVGIGAGAWDVINNIGDYVVAKAGVIAGWGATIGNGIGTAIIGALRAIVSGAKLGAGIGRTIANAVIGMLNRAIGRLNSALELTIKMPGPIPDIHIDPPDIPPIPQLALGGIVTKPTLAMIGERGPEAVLPLGKNGGGGGTAVFNLSIGGDRVASIVWDQLRNKAAIYEQQNGRSAFA